MDVNGDGKMDLVIGGNFYATDAQLGRYDASIGAVLIGDGTNTFQVVSPPDSGFEIPGGRAQRARGRKHHHRARINGQLSDAR
jgi:hypothetical protein